MDTIKQFLEFCKTDKPFRRTELEDLLVESFGSFKYFKTEGFDEYKTCYSIVLGDDGDYYYFGDDSSTDCSHALANLFLKYLKYAVCSITPIFMHIVKVVYDEKV